MENNAKALRERLRRWPALAALTSFALIAGAGTWSLVASRAKGSDPELTVGSLPGRPQQGRFSPTPAQWATLSVEPVTKVVFHPEHTTEGKIAVDEDRSTLIFSPFTGRVTKLLVKPGDHVERGQPLFVIEAAD